MGLWYHHSTAPLWVIPTIERSKCINRCELTGLTRGWWVPWQLRGRCVGWVPGQPMSLPPGPAGAPFQASSQHAGSRSHHPWRGGRAVCARRSARGEEIACAG